MRGLRYIGRDKDLPEEAESESQGEWNNQIRELSRKQGAPGNSSIKYMCLCVLGWMRLSEGRRSLLGGRVGPWSAYSTTSCSATQPTSTMAEEYKWYMCHFIVICHGANIIQIVGVRMVFMADFVFPFSPWLYYWKIRKSAKFGKRC